MGKDGLGKRLDQKIVVFSKSESRFHGWLRLAGKLDARAKRMKILWVKEGKKLKPLGPERMKGLD
jgi:hypothetical protein